MSVYNPLDYSAQRPIGLWWDYDGAAMAQCAFSTFRLLRDEQAYIWDRYTQAITLYENVDISDLDAWEFATWTGVDGPYQYNLIESIVDTIHSEIIAQRTSPQFITFDGDYLVSQKAEQLTKFLGGIFSELKIQDVLAPDICWDALIFGDGFAKVYLNEKNRLCSYRVFPWNIVFDDVEAANGPPQQLFEVKLLSRELLKRRYHGDAKAIEAIEAAPEYMFKARPARTVTDIIQVCEAWHVGDEDVPGKHAICLETGCLFEEEYTKDYFPFAHLRYKPRRKGWLGKGIPEILEGQQELINDFRDKINAQILGASPFIWTKPGSKLTEADISNEQWRVVESEEPPQHVTYQAIPPDLFQQFNAEQANASAQVGVNLLSLKSEVPPGIDGGSGKALRIYNDIKSKRMMRFARAYETWHIDLAELLIDVLDDLADTGEGYRVKAQDRSGIESIDFKNIRLPKDNFVIRPFPINFLSETPSGRLSDIEALANIFPDDMKPYLVKLLQNPDVEQVSARIGADTDAIEKICYKLLSGEWEAGDVPPAPFLNLELCVSVARQVLVNAYAKKAPTETIQPLLDWMAMAEAMLISSRPLPQMPIPEEMMPQEAVPQEMMPMTESLPPEALPELAMSPTQAMAMPLPEV